MHELRPEAARSLNLHRVRQEVRIRTLSVSILAVAAIAASLLITRHREAPATPASDSTSTDAQSGDRELDAIRAAGL
jgi:hypothetical protein